jgi:hypothetical protein
MVHMAPYDGEKEKRSPRHVYVSWAVGRFFLFIFLMYSTKHFFTHRLCEMAHAVLYDGEGKGGPRHVNVSWAVGKFFFISF